MLNVYLRQKLISLSKIENVHESQLEVKLIKNLHFADEHLIDQILCFL